MATRLLPTLGLLLALLAPAAGADGTPTSPGPASIDAAIQGGVDWLLKKQRARGTWGSRSHPIGPTALAVHALLHAGVSETDGTRAGKRLARALRVLDREGPGRVKRSDEKVGTYELSLMLLLLRSRGRAQDRPRMQRLAHRLVARQAENGQWGYGARRRGKPRTGDNSNAQFAVFALGAAVGEGLVVPREALERARAWWRSAAQPNGGFGYASGGSKRCAATGSMTAAGIACLAILDAALRAPQTSAPEGSAPEGRAPQANDAPAQAEDQVRARAVAYLASVYSVSRNHGPAKGKAGQRQRNAGRGWLHYYAWTLERAMVLHEARLLGTQDWYAKGATHLIASQNKDGSWRQANPLFSTSFALLFLSRAADPPRAFTPHAPRPSDAPAGPITGLPSAPTPPGPGPSPTPAAARALPPGSLEEWLRMPLPLGALAERCRLLGPSSLRPLVRGLRAQDAQVRQRAFEGLRALLPDHQTDRVDRHPLPRGRLDLWLGLHARDLELLDGRFVLR